MGGIPHAPAARPRRLDALSVLLGARARMRAAWWRPALAAVVALVSAAICIAASVGPAGRHAQAPASRRADARMTPLILLRRTTLRPAARASTATPLVALAVQPGAAAGAAPWWDGCAGAEQYLVTIEAPVTAVRRAALLAELRRSGGALAGYVPDHSFLLLANATVVGHLERLHFVQHGRPFELAWRLAPELDVLLGGAADESPAQPRLRLELTTVAAPGLRMGAVRAAAAALLGARGAVVAAHASTGEAGAAATGKLVLEVEPSAAQEAVLRLAAQPWAHWIAPASEAIRVRNFFAAGLMQSSASDGAAVATASLARPLWDAGIRGERQVVGIGDSGIDVRSCFFAHAYPRNASAAPLPPGPGHRKLLAYNSAFGDALDANGHGTHTAGSLAGACAAGPAQAGAAKWDGMAPAARLAFTDLGTGSGGRLFLPTSLQDFYAFAYSRGARVHSDSWGGDLSIYDTLAREVDEFAWCHRDFLPVFAAGNFGGVAGAAHVANPATSKNALAVGATLGPDGSAPHPTGGAAARVCELLVVAPPAAAAAPPVRLFLTGGADRAFAETVLGRGGHPWQLAVADPPDGCAPSMTAPPGSVLLLARGGGCSDAAKVVSAQTAGAAAVLLFNNDTGFFRLPVAPSWRIPAATLQLQDGVRLRAAAAAAAPGWLSVNFAAAAASEARHDTVAAFSSFGPTRDGRLKPDLVAPGETRSASAATVAAQTSASHPGSCDTASSAGTSMAAPVAAGAAVLVRQYFTDGLYPSGARRPADSFTPSGALIKAVLINGAAAMTGFTDAGLPLEATPNAHTGFGRVHLGQHALPLRASSNASASNATLPACADDEAPAAGASPAATQLFVSDDSAVATNEVQRYCLLLAPPAGSGAELRVTLAWHDPPALLSTGPKLVNDLDLRLTLLAPDGADAAADGRLDAAAAAPNRVDNVERRVVRAPGRAYLAEVAGASVPWPAPDMDGQPFALVATGPGLRAVKLEGGAASCVQALAALCSGAASPPPPPAGSRGRGCSLWAALFGATQQCENFARSGP